MKYLMVLQVEVEDDRFQPDVVYVTAGRNGPWAMNRDEFNRASLPMGEGNDGSRVTAEMVDRCLEFGDGLTISRHLPMVLFWQGWFRERLEFLVAWSRGSLRKD